jgi:hypothetical protein
VPDIGEVVRGSCLRAMANNRVQNPKCWAKSLDTCSTKLSREHLITEKLFGPRSQISVSKTKHFLAGPISRGSLASKILCKAHNAALSAVDEEALQLFSTLRAIHAKSKDVTAELADEYHFSTNLMERWLLKTLINFVASDAFVWEHPIRSGGDVVDARYVEVAFGLRKFSGHAGAYLIQRVENLNAWGEYFNVTPLTTEKGTVGGVVLRFCGLWFLLWTTAHVPIHPSVFRTVHVSGSELQKLPWDFTVSSNERQHHILRFV